MGGADGPGRARRPRCGGLVVAMYGVLVLLLLMATGAVVVADATPTATATATTAATTKTAATTVTAAPDDQPPVTPDPATPGTWISTGPD